MDCERQFTVMRIQRLLHPDSRKESDYTDYNGYNLKETLKGIYIW